MLPLALLLDALFGEPKWLWSRLPHPVVVIGKFIEILEKRFNQGSHRRAKGALVVLALSAISLSFGAVIAQLPGGWVLETLCAAILIAHRSLMEHIQAVARGLRTDLTEGRTAVSMIVGRDTSAMTESDVTRAAVESGAENFSDGVIAPALWFGVLGLPGILLYKTINTADSMIGHRTDRYEAFGWAAAKLDDVLNWVPARVTALLIAATHRGKGAFTTAMQEGPRHRSPNAGWPEAALARALGIAVSGPRSYGGQIEDHPFVNADGRQTLTSDDIEAATDALWNAWWGFLTFAVAAGIVTVLAT